MHYEYGEGEPIVLLYGLFGTVRNFDPLIKHLKKDYRVIVSLFPFYDNGYDVNIFSLVNFLENLIDKLQLEKFNLLGNSMGGHVAILYTYRHPRKVASLTLSGSSGLFENGMGDTFPRRKDYGYIKCKAESTFYDASVATKELVDEIYETVNSRRALHILSLAKSTIRNNVQSLLHHIHVPCCLIWGRNDVITPPQVAFEFKKHMPHAGLHWINHCGHVPMLERPAEFNRVIDEFLLSVNTQYRHAV